MPGHAVFLNGPIGAGKTTLGRGLAVALGGGFVDGDDHANPDLPWYGSILQTSRAIVRIGTQAASERGVVVVAYPLNCLNWIYFRRHPADLREPARQSRGHHRERSRAHVQPGRGSTDRGDDRTGLWRAPI